MTDTGSHTDGNGEDSSEDAASASAGRSVGFNAFPASLTAAMIGVLPTLDKVTVSTIIGSQANIAAIAGLMPKLDVNVKSIIGSQANIAAIAGLMPKLDVNVKSVIGSQANIAGVMLDIHQLNLRTGFDLGQTAVAAMTAISNARIHTLEQGFLKGSGTAADFFGVLDEAITTDQGLTDRLRRAVAATQRSGSFGFDYNSLRGEAAGLADRFDGEPQAERRVRSALEPVQELTGLTNELLIDYGEQLGWWRVITRHKISTAGIILGYTIGLLTFVVGAGSGISSAPSALVEALVVGGGIYKSVHSAEIVKP